MKLWGGRFKNKLDEKAFIFNESFSFDKILYEVDIIGSIAHVKMLSKQKIIDKKSSNNILKGLTQILNDIKQNKISLNEKNYEDIHSFIESKLLKIIGNDAKKLHTARSRNDQIALDLKLYSRIKINETKKNLLLLLDSINNIIKTNKKTILPGFTHLQKAQPVTLSHHFGAYKEMFNRDILRLESTLKRLNECPLGACALNGTTYNIDRNFTSKELGFDRPTKNSMDSVSDRDYVIEYVFNLSLIMMHLSRLSEEIIIWNSDDYKYITLSDKFSTGSSIMPQKKNPDIAELIRGKTGTIYGALMSVLSTMKSLPLTYNKDLQELNQIYFSSIKNANESIFIMSEMLKEIIFNKNIMEKSSYKGFINATDVADYLVKKGVPFRDAHHMVGELVLLCEEKNLTLDELSLNDYNKICKNYVKKDIYENINLRTCVNNRKCIGATGENKKL